MYHMNIINYPGFSNIRSEKSGFYPNSKFNVVLNVAKHVWKIVHLLGWFGFTLDLYKCVGTDLYQNMTLNFFIFWSPPLKSFSHL